MARKMEESFKGFFTPGMLFEAFGFDYIGPIDGHDLPMLIETLENVRKFDNAVLIHVLTKKGKGYIPAEKIPVTVSRRRTVRYRDRQESSRAKGGGLLHRHLRLGTLQTGC